MKGETLMSIREQLITMAKFSAAVIAIVLIGFKAFKRWAKREDLRRGRQIAMAHLDPNCAERPNRPREDPQR